MRNVTWRPRNISMHKAAFVMCFSAVVSTGFAMDGSGGASSGAGNAKIMQNFSEYKSGWNRQDPAGVIKGMHPQGTFTSPAAGENLSREDFAGWLKVFFGAIPDFKANVDQVGMLDENTLAEQWEISGTWTKPFVAGPLAGAAPTGRPFTTSGVTIIRFKDDKMVSQVQYFDTMSWLTQIGAIPSK
jgi:predicted ester cyclase